MKKIFNYFKNDIKKNYKHYVLMIAFLMLFLIRLDYYVFSPGSLIDLDDRIEVDGSYDSKGSFNLTYVTARNGNISNIILSYLIPSWDLVSMDEMRVEDENPKEIEERDKVFLRQTSYDAIIAAFKEANLEYTINSVDLTIAYIFSDAQTDLKIGDVVKDIDGKTINSVEELNNEVRKHKENDKVTIKVLRDKKEVECYAKLIKYEDSVIIGISIASLKNVTTNPKVEYIFKDNESGASRGLMCSLEIYNKITEFDLTKGRIIAGTGSIDENGVVGEISGVKYKLKGAVSRGASVFIVPTKNYKEALKVKEENNYDIILIEADTLHNVIEKLKEL